MIMSQPRGGQNVAQYRNSNYQNYMSYPTSQGLITNIPQSFSPKHAMYPQHQRSMHPRT